MRHDPPHPPSVDAPGPSLSALQGGEGKGYAVLPERGVLEIAGPDRVAFLQGLVSNDVAKVGPDRAIHAALLTAQGRYLHDFHVLALGESLFLDAEAARLADLAKRLSMFRLRSKVTLAPASDRFRVAAGWGEGAAAALGLPDTAGAATGCAGGLAYVDPRLASLGLRFLLPRDAGDPAIAGAGFAAATPEQYDSLRLGLGVPDGSRDLPVEKAILLEAGFDELNGIDWQKGCYVGQELTARTKYRALIKKRLLPVAIEGEAPAPGTLVLLGDEEAGELRSARDGAGLALLRLDALARVEAEGRPLTAGTARLHPRRPDWMRLPEDS